MFQIYLKRVTQKLYFIQLLCNFIGIDPETIKESLPNVIRGDYSVTITDQDSQTRNLTTLTSCNDTSAFYFTEADNATQALSAVGFSGILSQRYIAVQK